MSKNAWKSTKQWLEKTLDFRNVLQSRLILYLFFVLSLGNLYTFVMTGNGLYAAVFLLVGYLTSFFNKNMIVIMFSALAVSNILKYGSDVRVRDGFTGAEKEEDKTGAKKEGVDAEKDETKMAKEEEVETGKKEETIKSADVGKKEEKAKEAPEPSKKTVEKTTPEKIAEVKKSLNENSQMDTTTKTKIANLMDLQKTIMSKATEIAPMIKEAQSMMNDIQSKSGMMAMANLL
jgi:hypothetical protein